MRQTLLELAPIYHWLAERWIREIDERDWRELGQEPFCSLLVRFEPGLVGPLSSPLAPQGQEALAEEFARLFLLPAGIPPYVSNWIAPATELGPTREKISKWVEQSFVALGRQTLERGPWGRLRPDHVSVILDLVASATRSGRASDLEVAEQLDRDLLGPALEPFGRALAAETTAPLYRALGGLTASLRARHPAL